MLGLLLISFFTLEGFGIPVSAIAALGALVLLTVAGRGHKISIRRSYGKHPGLLDYLASHGLWAATLGTGVLTALLSSIMNNMPTVQVGALSTDASQATGVVKEAETGLAIDALCRHNFMQAERYNHGL